MPEFSWQNKPKGVLTFNIPQSHAQVGSTFHGQFKSPVLPEVFPTFQIPGLVLLSPPPQLPVTHHGSRNTWNNMTYCNHAAHSPTSWPSRKGVLLVGWSLSPSHPDTVVTDFSWTTLRCVGRVREPSQSS